MRLLYCKCGGVGLTDFSNRGGKFRIFNRCNKCNKEVTKKTATTLNGWLKANGDTPVYFDERFERL